MPASGGATVLRPGKNLATSRERAPCLEKTPSVRRTQESGSREILQSNCRTLIPLRRPIWYHTESATTAAKTQRKREPKKLSLPTPARAPAASINGRDGIGRPLFLEKPHAR